MRSTRSIKPRKGDSRPRRTPPHQITVAKELAEEFKKHQLLHAERARSTSMAGFNMEDLSPVPLALLSRRGVVVFGSKPLFELFNVPPEEILFQPLSAFLRREDMGAFFKFLADCRIKRRAQRAEFLMAVNERFPKQILLIVSPLEASDPERMTFRAAFIELTENEQRDSDPRIPQQDTRLMEVIGGIVWEADYPMRFTFVSRQAERILGFPTRNWIVDPDFWAKHIYHEDRDRVLQARAQAIKKPAAHVLHYRMLTANRKVIHVKDSAAIVAGAPGWTKISGIITDISDLEYAREGLKAANENLEASVIERTAKMQQSLDAMETLCYGIAHDFKAPVRALEGFTAMLIGTYENAFDDESRLYAGRCKAALRRMTELIDGVLSYGRLNHTLPELIPIHLRPLIQSILEPLEPDITAKNAKVNLQMTFPLAMGNPYLLEQVFTNLIANALKFTKPGVRPEISISATEVHPEPTASSREHADDSGKGPIDIPEAREGHTAPFVRITVTDNGIGIPTTATTRMFGMFQKLHSAQEYAGTGIGLAVVKRAVELMNGRVGVFSEPDHGSSFWIELPSAS